MTMPLWMGYLSGVAGRYEGDIPLKTVGDLQGLSGGGQRGMLWRDIEVSLQVVEMAGQPVPVVCIWLASGELEW